MPEMDSDHALTSRRYKLLFGVRRSIRYHNYRRQFCLSGQSAITFLILLLGAGSTASLLEWMNLPAYQKLAPVGITVLASLGLVVGLVGKASLHHDLYRRFIHLEREFLKESTLSWKSLNRLEDQRLEIEMDEPATYQALNRRCHNELVRSEGRYQEVLKLNVSHLLLMNFWRFDNLPIAQRPN